MFTHSVNAEEAVRMNKSSTIRNVSFVDGLNLYYDNSVLLNMWLLSSQVSHMRSTETYSNRACVFLFCSFFDHSSALIWHDCARYKTINIKTKPQEWSDLALATHHLSSFSPMWLWLFQNRKRVWPWKTGANESNAGRELFGSAFLPPRLGFLFSKPTNSVRTLLCNQEQRLGVPASLSDVINGAQPLVRLALPALQIFPWYLMNSDKLLYSHCVPPSLLSLPPSCLLSFLLCLKVLNINLPPRRQRAGHAGFSCFPLLSGWGRLSFTMETQPML